VFLVDAFSVCEENIYISVHETAQSAVAESARTWYISAENVSEEKRHGTLCTKTFYKSPKTKTQMVEFSDDTRGLNGVKLDDCPGASPQA